jgi:hypothetical protein
MRQPSVNDNPKLALNLDVIHAISSRTGGQAKLRANQWSALGVDGLEKIGWVLVRGEVKTNMLVCWSVTGGNHCPNADWSKLPRLVAFKCGKPRVEGVNAALQGGDGALVGSVVKVAKVSSYEETDSRDGQRNECTQRPGPRNSYIATTTRGKRYQPHTPSCNAGTEWTAKLINLLLWDEITHATDSGDVRVGPRQPFGKIHVDWGRLG